MTRRPGKRIDLRHLDERGKKKAKKKILRERLSLLSVPKRSGDNATHRGGEENLYKDQRCNGVPYRGTLIRDVLGSVEKKGTGWVGRKRVVCERA